MFKTIYYIAFSVLILANTNAQASLWIGGSKIDFLSNDSQTQYKVYCIDQKLESDIYNSINFGISEKFNRVNRSKHSYIPYQIYLDEPNEDVRLYATDYIFKINLVAPESNEGSPSDNLIEVRFPKNLCSLVIL